MLLSFLLAFCSWRAGDEDLLRAGVGMKMDICENRDGCPRAAIIPFGIARFTSSLPSRRQLYVDTAMGDLDIG